MTTTWKSSEAKALDAQVDADFAAGKIKDDTRKAGKFLALTINMVALNESNPAALEWAKKREAEDRAKYAELVKRDDLGS